MVGHSTNTNKGVCSQILIDGRLGTKFLTTSAEIERTTLHHTGSQEDGGNSRSLIVKGNK
jgi:hypothetical protein